MFASLLPAALQPYAKAVFAALVPILTAVASGLIVGEWDEAAILGGVTGLLTALLVYTTPNAVT